MTSENGRARKHFFVGGILPWLVAACGLVFYLATLNHWVSLYNFNWAAAHMGMSFGPELRSPLFYAVTYPFKWLPTKLIPLAFNAFTAACSALTLALLARSVFLLPHDRTHNQRIRVNEEFARFTGMGAWMPPLLAALVLGLQLTVWESATNGAKEILDLLLFAYVIRCVLEFRITERESWLYRASFVYAAGMTGNWALIALLPALIFAMVWIRGVSFFNLRFLFWMFVWGCAGLLLYLLLPLVYVNSDLAQGSVWQALKLNLKAQKDVLWFITHNLPANIILLLALTSLLPVLLIGIRWASRFGDPSALGSTLTTAVFYVSHAALLLICLWAAFDPGFGPRRISLTQVKDGRSLLFLLLFLSALSVGYFSGYLLLISVPVRGYTRRIPGWKFAVNRGVQGVVALLLVLVSAGLIYKNLPQIRVANGDAVARLASEASKRLPERAVVLSDDPIRMFLVRAWIAGNSAQSDRIFLETARLPMVAYYNQQQAQHRDEWLPPADPKSQGVDPRNLVQLILKLSEQRPVYYLHPSFGYYFEAFYPVPRGNVFEMRAYKTNSVSPPPLTDQEIAENDSFWQENRQGLDKLAPFISEPMTERNPGFRTRFLEALKIPYEPAQIAQVLGSIYSLSLNVWGVQAQIANHLNEAANAFQTALAMNPENIAAKRNLEFNKDLRAGITPTIKEIKNIQDDFLKLPYRDAQQMMRACGPFDEPTHRFAQGIIDVQGGLSRQAAVEFERILALVPDYVPALAAVARMYSVPFPDKSLALIPKLKALAAANPDAGLGKYDLLGIEATALYAAHKDSRADQLLSEAMAKNPNDNNLLGLVFQISGSFKSYTNALTAVDYMLENMPDDSAWLVNKGFLHIQCGDFQNAIPPLTKALNLDTNNVSARFDRAIAYLGANKLQEARQDYDILEKQFPGAFQVYYGLGEIAWREKDTNTARKYYDLYLANAPAGSEEANMIRSRAQSLAATNSPAPPQ